MTAGMARSETPPDGQETALASVTGGRLCVVIEYMG